jgi:hypothetical protein
MVVGMSPSTTDWVGAAAAGVAAVGTVGTLIAGLVQIGNERSARRRDEEEARQHARRAQAVLVSAWPAPGSLPDRTGVALLNGSESPVYRAVASLVMIQGAGPHDGLELRGDQLRQLQSPLALIPPGRSYTSVSEGWKGMMRRPGVELAFTDGAGLHWLRSADGTLSELSSAPADYYDMTRPLSWVIPTEAP